MGDAWWPDFKLIILLFGVLCFEVCFVFIILKEDHYESKSSHVVSHWSWSTIIGIPAGTGALFCCLWTYWNFVGLRPPSIQKLSDPKTFTMLGINNMEQYLEMEMFRRVLLMLWYLFFTCASGYISVTHCVSCETPYNLLAVGIAVCYGLRLLTCVYTTFKCYFRNHLAVKELGRFQDTMDPHRLYKRAFPDIYGAFTPNAFWLNTTIFTLTVVFALVASSWIANKNCIHECHQVFINTKVLLLGVCAMEVLFSLASVVERYWRRSSGVEIVERAVKFRESQKKMRGAPAGYHHV